MRDWLKTSALNNLLITKVRFYTKYLLRCNFQTGVQEKVFTSPLCSTDFKGMDTETASTGVTVAWQGIASQLSSGHRPYL